ncbi:hypothetical protein LCGC14_1963230 [marine sediment metagenome]|uniref:Uncharacterized protein n=1 Tax=marine sediment metagenome TaxID=412755 RepID=A0A0F9G2B0_9ZZZZ
MKDVVFSNQLGPTKGGKIKRYRRRHLRALLDRENEERAYVEKAQKRNAQWLRSYDNPS